MANYPRFGVSESKLELKLRGHLDIQLGSSDYLVVGLLLIYLDRNLLGKFYRVLVVPKMDCDSLDREASGLFEYLRKREGALLLNENIVHPVSCVRLSEK